MKLFNILIFAFILFFIGCFNIDPEKVKNSTYIEYPEKNVSKYPVVFFFPGSGGSHNNSYDWCKWYEKYGFACVFIPSKQIRKVRNLMKIDYARDLSIVLDIVKNDKKLDLNNYIVMGFSKGGTMAMRSALYLKDDQPKPKFVFALYPGGFDGCQNFYEPPTDVLIFYGDKDEWGNYRNIRQNCEETAKIDKNVYFYLLKNAHHGYDGNWGGGFQCCGDYFIIRPNDKALKKTQQIILEKLRSKKLIY